MRLGDGVPCGQPYRKFERYEFGHVEGGVTASVMNTEYETSNTKYYRSNGTPEDIKILKVRCWLLDGDERKDARKKHLKERRKWKNGIKTENLKAASEYKRRRSTFIAPMEMVVEGVATRDRLIWKQGLANFIHNRYFVDKASEVGFTERMQQLRGAAMGRRID